MCRVQGLVSAAPRAEQQQAGQGAGAPHILHVPHNTSCRVGAAPGDALDGSAGVREVTEGGQRQRVKHHRA